jgi:hypothetical protein
MGGRRHSVAAEARARFGEESAILTMATASIRL